MKLSEATLWASVYLQEEGRVVKGKITHIEPERIFIAWEDGQSSWAYQKAIHGISLAPLNPTYTKKITVSVELTIEHDGLSQALLEKIGKQAEERFRESAEAACYSALRAQDADVGYTLMDHIKKWEVK